MDSKEEKSRKLLQHKYGKRRAAELLTLIDKAQEKGRKET
jgi:predicted Zn-dependent protease